MTGEEFVGLSREIFENFNKGTALCHDIRTELNEEYRKGWLHGTNSDVFQNILSNVITLLGSAGKITSA